MKCLLYQASGRISLPLPAVLLVLQNSLEYSKHL